MALNAAIQFEVRAAGSATNGGGFKTGASGTDWSQQDVAQYSVTDAVGNSTTTVTSATANFGTDVVGNVAYIQGNWYEITARNSTTSITVDRATGTFSGGTLKIGGALDSLATAASVPAVTGNVFWIKSGSYSHATGITLAWGNTIPSVVPNLVLGYNVSRGDNPTGSNRPILTATAAIDLLSVTDSNTLLANLILDCNSTGNRCLKFSGTNPERGSRAVNVSARNFKVLGLTGGTSVFIGCDATGGNSGATAGFADGSLFFYCWARGNTCHGFGTNGGGTWVGCVSAGNTGALSDGFNFDSNSLNNSVLMNCVAYGNGRDGIRFTGTYEALTVLNCILEANGGYGIRSGLTYPAVAVPHFNVNAFYNNTSGARNGLTAGANDVTLTGTAFVDAANGNFALNNTAGGGAACRAAGFPGLFPAGLTTGYLDIGAAQHQDAGVGSVVLRRGGTVMKM